jgi:hypothetical protein
MSISWKGVGAGAGGGGGRRRQLNIDHICIPVSIGNSILGKYCAKKSVVIGVLKKASIGFEVPFRNEYFL